MLYQQSQRVRENVPFPMYHCTRGVGDGIWVNVSASRSPQVNIGEGIGVNAGKEGFQ